MSENFESYTTHKEQPKAFPVTGPVANQGMDLRDWFAGMALQGMCAHHETWGLKAKEVVSNAFALADEMMKERKA